MLANSWTKKRNYKRILIDTKSVFILGLEAWENLELTKRIYSLKSTENSLPSDFLDCFGVIETLN